MEALIGDPINTVVDQEAVLLLYHYGFTQLYGASAKYIGNLMDGKSELLRQIVEFEDYRKSVPQLQYTAPEDVPNDQADLGSGSRPSEADHGKESSKRTAKVFAPGGMQYDLPESERAPEKPNIDLRPRSERVGGKCQICASTTSGQVTATIACSQSDAIVKLINSEASASSTSITKNAKPKEEGHNTYTIWPRDRQWHRTIVTKPQSTLSWTNGEAGGTKTHKTRVAARGDLSAETGREGQIEGWTYYPR